MHKYAYKNEQILQEEISYGVSRVDERPQVAPKSSITSTKSSLNDYTLGAFFDLPTRSQPVQVFDSNPQVLNDNVNPRLPLQCQPRHPEETIKLGSLADKELEIPKYTGPRRGVNESEERGGFWLFNRPDSRNIKYAVVVLFTLALVTVLIIIFWMFWEKIVKK